MSEVWFVSCFHLSYHFGDNVNPSAVRETLESRGVLGQLKARIRAEVFSALDDQREPRPQLSHENLLINELIREYLEYNRYRYTASVLTAGGWADRNTQHQHQ